MATSLPYLASNKNIETLFSKIHTAKVPDKFSQEFLSTTIGLKGSNDRTMIPLLRNLQLIDQSGSPLPAYRLLKRAEAAKRAIAVGIRHAYRPLFEANENAHSLPSEKLKGLVAQVAGTDSDMTARIVATFSTLVKQADFSSAIEPSEAADERVEQKDQPSDLRKTPNPLAGGLRPEFHYNIQIHLPSNATEEIYINIFNALRKTFQ